MPRRLPSLPFHLTLQGMLFAASNSALQQAKLASPSLSANWQSFADPHQLEQAVNHQLKSQNAQLLRGIHSYLNHPYTRPEPAAQTVWQAGGSRLLDYGVDGEEKAAVLFAPSLINRYYILDLMEGHSLIAYLRNHGIRAFVLDWGDPGESEQNFTLSDYIHRLEAALTEARHASRTPLILSGYCMGGLLAIAAALRQERHLHGLALLAMPWDFHAKGFPRVPLSESHRQKLEQILARQPIFSGDVIQTLFYSANPWVFARKFAHFDTLQGPFRTEFVAIESWVNDNVDMTSAVARECLIDWVQENRPVQGRWKVGSQPVLPDALALPVFAACPTQDTIVPPGSAEAILPAFPHATVCRPFSGHVGMVAGPRAERELWQPFQQWIASVISV